MLYSEPDSIYFETL